MGIIRDPEGNETSALFGMVDFKDHSVLEIGCGDGRFTWLYANKAAHITAIDPNGKAIETARADLPKKSEGRVHFFESTIEEFAKSFNDRKFNIAIYSWSL